MTPQLFPVTQGGIVLLASLKARTKLALCLILLLSLAIPTAIWANTTSGAIRLVVDGKEVQPDVPPVLQDGRVLVPVRWVAEALGANVEWDAAKNAVLINTAPEAVNASSGTIQLFVNGKLVQPDVPPATLNGRTLVPVRWVSEALGAVVNWDGAGQVVYVYSGTKENAGPQEPASILLYYYFNDLAEGTVYTANSSGDFVVQGNGQAQVKSIAGDNKGLTAEGVTIRHDLGSSAGKRTAEVKFMQPQLANAAPLELKHGDVSVAAFAVENGKLIYRGQTGQSPQVAVDALEPGQWYTVKIVANLATGQAEFFLNERPLGTQPIERNLAAIDSLSVNAGEGVLWLDDLLAGKGRIDVPMGFGSTGQLTTGGLGGQTVIVTTKEELLRYMQAQEPYMIFVQGTIDLGSGMHKVASNKTIMGLDGAVILNGGLRMEAVNNVVIRNLTFKSQPDDGIEIRDGSTHIWIDHNSIGTVADGGVDSRIASDFITISWNHFKDTGKTSLVGSSDSETQSRGHLKITYHHNWFENTNSRNPLVRFGQVHVLNNYYLGVRNYGARAYTEGSVLVEANLFRNTKTPVEIVGGMMQVRNNVLDNSGELFEEGTVFDPWQSYTFPVDPADKLDQWITEWAGAGKLNAADYQ